MKELTLFHAIISKFLAMNPNQTLWINTHNDVSHTHIYTVPTPHDGNGYVVLLTDEYPLLECSLQDGNYFLITTDRVISYYRNCLQTQFHKDFINFDFSTYKFIDRDNKNQKTEFYILEYKEDKVFYEIDSYAPSHLAIELIRIIAKIFDSENLS
jgi:hypothetical protein